jgi:hypothetical protein
MMKVRQRGRPHDADGPENGPALPGLGRSQIFNLRSKHGQIRFEISNLKFQI